jgi:DNA processing protein
MTITRQQLISLAQNTEIAPKNFSTLCEFLLDKAERKGGPKRYKFEFTELPDREFAAEAADLVELAVKQQPAQISELLIYCDARYPKALRHSSSPPKRLFYRGNLKLLKRKLLSVVGTRKMSNLGAQEARRLVNFCAEFGLVTVSGMAQGVDETVHKGCLEAAVPTIAVLHSWERAGHPLAQEIIAAGGLILSEKGTQDQYTKSDFPMRNRIIAALSLATVVIEAPVDSGSMITARAALREGRDVFVAAPGYEHPNFSGNYELLDRDQARVLTPSYRQLRDALQIPASKSHLPAAVAKNLPKSLREILQTVSAGIDNSADIADYLGIGVAEISKLLAKMQFDNLICKDELGRYKIV